MPKAKGSSYRVSRPRGVLPGSVANVARETLGAKGVAKMARQFRAARASSPGKVTKEEKQIIRQLGKAVAGPTTQKEAKGAMRRLTKRAGSTYKGKGGKKGKK